MVLCSVSAEGVFMGADAALAKRRKQVAGGVELTNWWRSRAVCSAWVTSLTVGSASADGYPSTVPKAEISALRSAQSAKRASAAAHRVQVHEVVGLRQRLRARSEERLESLLRNWVAVVCRSVGDGRTSMQRAFCRLKAMVGLFQPCSHLRRLAHGKITLIDAIPSPN